MAKVESQVDQVECVWTILVAAGSGNRFGGAKQYQLAHGQRVLDWSIFAAQQVSDGVVLVVHPEFLDQPEPAASAVVAGGQTRTESVRNGLAAVPVSATVVLVHDAARPCATADLFRRVVAEVTSGQGVTAVVPGVTVNDTVKRVEMGSDGRAVVAETLPRDRLRAIQTPQGFRAETLRDMYASGHDATDDSALAEANGIVVSVIEGEVRNVKVTHRDDLEFVERILRDRAIS